MNLHGFAEGDPVNHSDPFGLCPPEDNEPCSYMQRFVNWSVRNGHEKTANVAAGVQVVGEMLLAGLSSSADCGEGVTCGVVPMVGAPRGGTNPFSGPVGSRVFVADPKGNVIPVQQGQSLTGRGQYLQVRGGDGKPTGMRMDGPHKPKGHPDPRAQQPHAHVPGVTNPDGSPWLPVKP